MKVSEIISAIEYFAAPELQEDYDNSGWQCGLPETKVEGVLICLDITESVIEEAVSNGCDLIISHHPVIFKGLKKLIGSDATERILMKALKHEISLYSIHTNLDAVKNGVNAKIAEKIGLAEMKILQPKTNVLQKITVFCPMKQASAVREAMWQAGAGEIGDYSQCSFNLNGEGTFRAGSQARPFVGEIGQLHMEKEERIEMIVPAHLTAAVIHSMLAAHPYEEVAYDIFPLANAWKDAGSGMIGRLEKAMTAEEFLKHLKSSMQTDMIRHTSLPLKPIQKVAICGGAGRFLLETAKARGADVLVTADFKYHDFFDADGKILVADIGHFESEQFTSELLRDWITRKFDTFAVRITETNTNPVNYY